MKIKVESNSELENIALSKISKQLEEIQEELIQNGGTGYPWKTVQYFGSFKNEKLIHEKRASGLYKRSVPYEDTQYTISGQDIKKLRGIIYESAMQGQGVNLKNKELGQMNQQLKKEELPFWLFRNKEIKDGYVYKIGKILTAPGLDIDFELLPEIDEIFSGVTFSQEEITKKKFGLTTYIDTSIYIDPSGSISLELGEHKGKESRYFTENTSDLERDFINKFFLSSDLKTAWKKLCNKGIFIPHHYNNRPFVRLNRELRIRKLPYRIITNVRRNNDFLKIGEKPGTTWSIKKLDENCFPDFFNEFNNTYNLH